MFERPSQRGISVLSGTQDHRTMKRIPTRVATSALSVIGAFLLHPSAKAQLAVATAGVTYTVNFDGTVSGVGNGAWAGTGFTPTPLAGRLDSDAWSVSGWSDGGLAFGGTKTSGDYNRGASAVAVTTGGMYSFSGAGITGNALGVQPAASDWAPGWISMRIRNTTGGTLTAFDIAYNAFYRNDEASSSSFNFSYSTNGISYTAVPALNLTSPAAASGAAWVANPFSTTISGLSIANNAYFYIRWSGADVSVSGGRDEFALDDIQVTGQAYTQLRFTGATSTVLENGVSTVLTVAIVNPSPTLSTSADVVLTSGSAARINSYTTQTVVFPAASSANQTVTITVTDNGACDLNALEVFQLQNISGGSGVAHFGNPSQHTLTVDDDETGTYTPGQQYFDGGVNDNWSILSGGGSINSATGAADFPANQRILSSPNSWQISNVSDVLDLGTVSTLGMSNIVISARLSSVAASSGAGTDATDSVKFWVDVDGGGFPVTPDVIVRGQSNSRWGYSTGTGVASTAAGTPINLAPASGGNRTTDGYSTVQITVPDGTTTVALRIRAQTDAAGERWNIDNVQVSGTLCEPIYYSRNNGSETSVTWSTTRTGAASAVTFDKNATMVIQNTHTITTSGSNFNVKNLSVETGGALSLGGTTTVGVYGPTFDLNGPFTSTDDNLGFFGSSLQTISGTTTPVEVNDLTLDGSGLLVGVATLKIRGTLQLDNGNFNANSKIVQLVSNASGTARLGPVAPTASYSSLLQIDRYVPAGVTDWRLLASPIQNKTVQQWADDFVTAGFPGSQYPGFDSPPGSNILWPSVRWYDETNTGALSSDGLNGVPSITDPLTIGKGFAAWSGTNLNSTFAFTIDLRGVPQIANTPVTLPMTYTNTGNPTVDGLNLVGNPVPSPIDFTTIAKGADVDNFYYIYDPGSGTNATWDENTLMGAGGANGNIQSSQGFWLHATGPAVTTTVSETDKVLEPVNGGVFSLPLETREMVRMRIEGGGLTFSDETVVHFISGEPGFDVADIAKFDLRHPLAPMICTQADGQRLAINAHGTLLTEFDVPVVIDVAQSGTYTVSFRNVEPALTHACMTFVDLLAGISVPVSEGLAVSVQLDANEPMEGRFKLHVCSPFASSEELSAGIEEGDAGYMNAWSGNEAIVAAWVPLASGSTLVDVIAEDGRLLEQQQVASATGRASFSTASLTAGTYLVRITNGANTRVFRLPVVH